MKSAYGKLAVTIVPLIALVLLLTAVVNLARKVDRIQTGALSQQQPGPELLNGSYNNLLNNLFAAGGR